MSVLSHYGTMLSTLISSYRSNFYEFKTSELFWKQMSIIFTFKNQSISNIYDSLVLNGYSLTFTLNMKFWNYLQKELLYFLHMFINFQFHIINTFLIALDSFLCKTFFLLKSNIHNLVFIFVSSFTDFYFVHGL